MTRTSPVADFLFPSVTSFFSRQVALCPSLTVHILRRRDSGDFSLALLDLHDLGEQLKTSSQRDNILRLLSPDETTIFTSFTYPKRQAEWLGGRIAAKSAVTALQNDGSLPEHFPHFSIIPEKNGSPEIYPAIGQVPRISISISHSSQYATGLASHAPACGLDIQKITPRTKKVQSRFAEPEELNLLKDNLPDLDEIKLLSLLWSAKEALKKSLLRDQPVLFQGVVLKMILPGKTLQLFLQHAGSGPDLNIVESVVLGDYILAYTQMNESHARTPRS